MKGWIPVTKRLPDVPDPVCYFPANAFFRTEGMMGAATISTIQYPGHWIKRGKVPFTHWRTIESLSPTAASRQHPLTKE